MRQILAGLEELVKELELKQREKYLPQIEEIRRRLDYPDMKLAVIGNFSCGKSTFLNALLKTSLLTMDNMPTTSVPTYIDWNGKTGKIIVFVTDTKGVKHFIDQNGRRWFRQAAGKELPEDMGEMLDYLTTTNTLTHTLSKINISFPEKDGYKGFCIVDTPGVNPGDGKASDHILKTQALLRDEADAAIILFPSYQVYTRDFQEFLDQNAKHLLADSIFVVSKMDLAPNKERNKLLRFVKGRLEQYFGLEDPEVFGCSAGCALEYYSGHTDVKDSWTDDFEQMLENIFQELAIRRNRIVTEKTKKMAESLICELQAEIKERQEVLLKAKQSFATYSYENLEKEYKSGLAPYYHAILPILKDEKNVMQNAVWSKANHVLNELTVMVSSAENSKQLNALTDKIFRDKMQEFGKELEKQFFVSMQALSSEMNKKYEGLMTAMQGLLDRYQCNVGEFETFAYERKKIEGQNTLSVGQLKGGNIMVPLELTDLRGAAVAIAAVGSMVLGPLGALAGWALYRFTLSQQKEKVIVQIKGKIDEYAAAVMQQYDDCVPQMQKRYNEAGERLLTEYTKEYKSFFEEKERQMKEYYKANIKARIENERRIAYLDEMARAILNADLDEMTQAISKVNAEETKRVILFLGSFTAGKSTLINALLREDLLKTGIVPCTSMITSISYGMGQKVRLCYFNGASGGIEIRRERLSEFSVDEWFDQEELVVANVFSPNLPKGIYMIDTPEFVLNRPEFRLRLYELIDCGAAIIFVINAVQVFSSDEEERIDEVLARGFDKEQIWFVITHMDSIRKVEVEKFKKWVYHWLAFVYKDKNGNYDEQLYNRRVFFVKSRDAYDIRMGNKTDIPEEATGIPALERSLGLYAGCGKHGGISTVNAEETERTIFGVRI